MRRREIGRTHNCVGELLESWIQEIIDFIHKPDYIETNPQLKSDS